MGENLLLQSILVPVSAFRAFKEIAPETSLEIQKVHKDAEGIHRR